MSIRQFIHSTFVVIALMISSVSLAQVSLTEGGVSGQWYNANRDGEGLFVEIVDSGDSQQISVAWFTYDTDGFQMWLVGNVVLEGSTSVTIPVVVTNGPKFGQDYDMADLNRQTWGTLTLTFPDCNTALLSYASSVDGFGSGAINLVRLTNLTQVRCTDVEPPPGSGITPGRWSGNQVCFNVSQDGRTLTSEGSTCDNGRAFDSDIDSTNNGNPCDAEVQCQGVIAIVDGSFSCTSSGEIAVGTFHSESSASGAAQETETSGVCTANWTATPDNP